MAKVIPQSYDDFDRQYELLRKFGPEALKNQLQLEAKQQGNTLTIDRSVVSNMFGAIVNQHFDSAFAAQLKTTQQHLEQHQTPRGDNRPEAKNRHEGVTANPSQRFKNAPWMAKMDLAADPKINAAFQDIANQLNTNPNANLTTQFNNVLNRLENALRNEYKLRMAPKMQPKPGAKPRPQGS